MKYHNYTHSISIDATTILVVTQIGGFQLSGSVTRGGSEDTDLATLLIAHKAAALDTTPTSTSPPCSVLTRGKLGAIFAAGSGGGDVTAPGTVINVPASNSGVLVLRADPTDATSNKYQINAGSWTTFTDGDTITVSDGDTLKLQTIALPPQEASSGSVEDQDTGVKLDEWSLYNSSLAP